MVKTSQCQSDNNKNTIIMDLQHFAEPMGEPSIMSADAPAPTSFAELGDMYVKSVEEGTSTVESSVDTATEPAVTEQQPKTDVIDLLKQKGITKFNDPEKFVNSHLELEKWSTKLAQDKAALSREVADLKRAMQAAPVVQPPQQQSPSTFEMDADEFTSKLYEDPVAALAPLKDAWRAELMQELSPMLSSIESLTNASQESQVIAAHQSAMREFFETTEVTEEFSDSMREILFSDPAFTTISDKETIKDLMGKALTYVKGMAYQAPVTMESAIESLLNDPDKFQKYIAGNQDIRSRLLSGAVQQIQSTRIPPTISTPGVMPLIPIAPKPNDTFESLGESIKRSLGVT